MVICKCPQCKSAVSSELPSKRVAPDALQQSPPKFPVDDGKGVWAWLCADERARPNLKRYGGHNGRRQQSVAKMGRGHGVSNTEAENQSTEATQMTIGFELEPKCTTDETPQPSSEPPHAAKLAHTVAATTPSSHERLALKRSSVAMMQPTRAARARIECGVRIAPSVKRPLFQFRSHFGSSS